MSKRDEHVNETKRGSFAFGVDFLNVISIASSEYIGYIYIVSV